MRLTAFSDIEGRRWELLKNSDLVEDGDMMVHRDNFKLAINEHFTFGNIGPSSRGGRLDSHDGMIGRTVLEVRQSRSEPYGRLFIFRRRDTRKCRLQKINDGLRKIQP